ncbi:MAG: S8 family serine peptidase [Desulfitobacteriia bacterium]
MFKKYLRPLIAAILALILAIPLTIWNPGLALGNDGSKTLVPRNDGNETLVPGNDGNETLVPGSGDNRTPALGNDNTQTSFHRAYDPKAIRLVVEVTQVADLDALAAAVGGELVRTGPLNYCTLEFRPESLKAENSHDPAVEPIINEEQKKSILAKVLDFPGVLGAEWSKTYKLTTSEIGKLTTSETGKATAEAGGEITITDPEYTLQWALRRIRADQAWAEGATGKGVIIAVVDTGVDLDHPDLVDDTLHRSSLIQGYNAFTRSSLPGADQDDNGHGTSVAGAIAALNNDEGIVGVAYEAMIMPIKAMDHTGEGEDSIIADGIIWAVDHGAKIINLSIGSDTQAKVLDDALEYAADQGCLLVAASGNKEGNTEINDNAGRGEAGTGPNSVAYPGAHPAVMAVSAVDMHDTAAPFALTGPEVEISAPGSKILTSYWTKNETGCAYSTGTSIAAPFVSGAAALLWSKYPDLTAAEIRQALLSSAYDLGAKGRDNKYGFGRLDIYRALQALEEEETETFYSSAALGWQGGKIYAGGTAEEPAALLTVPKDTFPLRVTGMGVEEKINISLQTAVSAQDFPEGIIPAGETIIVKSWGEVPAKKALGLSLKLKPPSENAALSLSLTAPGLKAIQPASVTSNTALNENGTEYVDEGIAPTAPPEPVLTAYLYKWSGSRWLKVGGGVTDPAKVLEAAIYEPGTYRAGWSLEQNTERLAGNDRIATALEIALEAFPGGADTVIIARADDFPDALAGAPLAYKLQAPILLTYPEELPAEVYRFIADSKPKKIFLLGGTGAISPAVESKLLELAYTYRIAGNNRYATAAAVADMLGTTGQAIIVNGLNFPDAIAAASHAALQGKPILLTPAAGLAPETAEALRRLSVTRAEVIGGPAVISEEVTKQLISPERIGGANRFATSAEVIRRNTPTGDVLYIATGMAFPDALTGGILAALDGSGILLIPPSGPTPEQAKVLETLKGRTIIALGGEEAVPKDALNIIRLLLISS